MSFERQQATILRQCLAEVPRHIIIIAGPRQVGKSYMVREILRQYPSGTSRFVAADNPEPIDINLGLLSSAVVERFGATPTTAWLVEAWRKARLMAKASTISAPFVFVVDEIQKIPRWSDVVKGLWDEDRASGLNMNVVLLGSSPWLMQKGLSESLLGRFKLIKMTHWSYQEMQMAFDFNLDEYIYFGGYPGMAGLINDELSWREQIRDSFIEPHIRNDILQMTRVDKPALLEALFKLGATYSGQILAYNKMLGQLADAGNTTTLAHYLGLLSHAGLLTGLTQYAGNELSRRKSSPKLHVLNTAFKSALANYQFESARTDRTYWGRLVESAVGAHLVNTAASEQQVYYWREGQGDNNPEVDFVIVSSQKLFALEVKSGRQKSMSGLRAFVNKYPATKKICVGEEGITIAEFLSRPLNEWTETWL